MTLNIMRSIVDFGKRNINKDLNLCLQFTGCFLLQNYPLNLLQFNIANNKMPQFIFKIADIRFEYPNNNNKKSHSIRYQTFYYLSTTKTYLLVFQLNIFIQTETLNKNIHSLYGK